MPFGGSEWHASQANASQVCRRPDVANQSLYWTARCLRWATTLDSGKGGREKENHQALDPCVVNGA